jgi:hypothetical protein
MHEQATAGYVVRHQVSVCGALGRFYPIAFFVGDVAAVTVAF